MLTGQRGDDVAGVVGRFAVGDEDLVAVGGVVLRQELPQRVGQEGALVADRDDDRDHG